MTFVSYAQNFEDVLLWRALHDVEHGRYLDVGAHDPLVDSVSQAFYEAGWRGIHVEPTPHYAELLRKARPDEIVLQAAVTDATGPIPIYELGGLSSGCKEIAQHHEESGHRPREIFTATVGLDKLLAMFDADVHWLKIDVEGMEANVLRSWRDCPIRPWILVVESTFPNSERPTQQMWIDEVLRRGYEEVFFDGLSRYFLHEAHAELGDRLNRPANVFDAYQITLQHFSAKKACEAASSLQKAHEVREAQQAALTLELRERSRFSTMELDKVRTAQAALEKQSAADRAQLEQVLTAHSHDRSRLEEALIELAAKRARLEGLSATQRERDGDVGKLKVELRSEREARANRDAEIAEIVKLADPDFANSPDFETAHRPVANGLAYAAVKTRLQVAMKELDLLRVHADRQYAAGEGARDGEVTLLQERIAALQAEISFTRDRLNHFEVAYASARNQCEATGKEKTRLKMVVDDQIHALETVATDSAELNRQLTETRERLASIYRSRGGRFASFLGLLPPTTMGFTPTQTRLSSINASPSADESTHTPNLKTEIAVNDVRHVNILLAQNGTAFVDALYRTFLKRAPDRAGRDHFVSRLQAGHGKEAVLLAVATSKEAQAIGAPMEGVAELQRAQARKSGRFAVRDRALEERLNRLEHIIGEAHNRLFDRLDGIQNSVEQMQAAISGGAGISSKVDLSGAGSASGIRQSIKQGFSVEPSASASEFIDSLRREVQSSSEAQTLRRS